MLYIDEAHKLINIEVLPLIIPCSIDVILNGIKICVYLSKSDFKNRDIVASFNDCLAKRFSILDEYYICPLNYHIDYTATELTSNYVADEKLSAFTNFIYIDSIHS